MSGEKKADVTDLFTPEMIDAKFYLQEVKANDYDSYSVIDIMKGCNTIWRWRLKVKKEGWPDINGIEYICGEFLKKNQKISAIKKYRQYMIFHKYFFPIILKSTVALQLQFYLMLLESK